MLRGSLDKVRAIRLSRHVIMHDKIRRWQISCVDTRRDRSRRGVTPTPDVEGRQKGVCVGGVPGGRGPIKSRPSSTYHNFAKC